MNSSSDSLINPADNLTLWISVAIGGFLAIGFQIILNLLRNRHSSNFLSAYRVIFLGPPGSGKTSAIISLLDYMINSDISGYLRLRGPDTIANVERGAIELRQGLFPSPTPEASTNIYRLDYFPPISIMSRISEFIVPIPKAFRIEIADFAGELTDDFVDSEGAMKDTALPSVFGEDAPSNYLKWVAESDRCLLFVDMERYLREGAEFSELLTAKYIALWQRYLDLHSTQIGRKAGTPVVIVHTKCDLGYNADGEIVRIHDNVERLERTTATDFRRLYHFMEENSRELHLVFTSVVEFNSAGNRTGMRALADAVLPKLSHRRREGKAGSSRRTVERISA
jgi:hypothetical protein